MVNWSDSWSDKVDADGYKIRKWSKRIARATFWCYVCNKKLKFKVSSSPPIFNQRYS